MNWVILPTDWAMYGMVGFGLLSYHRLKANEEGQRVIRCLWQDRMAKITCILLFSALFIALCDSIHWTTPHHTHALSLLDHLLSPLRQHEDSYSAPFAQHAWAYTFNPFTHELEYASLYHVRPLSQHTWHVLGYLSGCVFILYLAKARPKQAWKSLSKGLGLLLIFYIILLCSHYHILGTDKVGQDLFYISMKSIRTAMLIGLFANLISVPLALFFGLSAGYFGGKIDHVIQTLYTSLTAIPNILLISALTLSLNLWLTHHPAPTLLHQSEYRLLMLCIILGLTNWPSLCRMLRGEAMRHRQMTFVDGARLMGIKHPIIMFRHILPHTFSLILMTVALDFSGLVLAEAVLSYVGIGVDPSTYSWGNIINAARLELSQSPIIWWPLFSAFLFMFTLVLSANLFSERLRDALDPHQRFEH